MRARKSLGQHFLTHRPWLERIAAATGAGPDAIVLEIGPGPGGLTSALLDRGAAVVAIERDVRFFDGLRRRFSDQPFVLASGDALTLDWPGLVAPWTVQGRRWLVAGNIPYNITTPLIAKALTPPFPAAITFLVQREVADRIVAGPGSSNYGALSIGVQAAAHASIVLTIGKGAFVPRPKVDSALLHLVPLGTPLLPAGDTVAFRRMVTSLFSYRRKRLARALSHALHRDIATSSEMLASAGLGPGCPSRDRRPRWIRPAVPGAPWRSARPADPGADRPASCFRTGLVKHFTNALAQDR